MSIQTISVNKQNQKTTDFRTKYKTQKCRLWYEKGYCPFNKFCAFAHNQQEIREKKQLNLKYKTKPCSNFFNNEFCKYGDRCQYLHSIPKNYFRDEKARSDSEETCSSKSSFQTKIKQPLSNKNQFKYRLRLDYIESNQLKILEILNGQKSKLKQIFDSEELQFEVEYFSRCGNFQEKKLRMYSL